MNEKESMMHKATRKALDVMIRRTYDGWPPFSPCGVYQPHRPDNQKWAKDRDPRRPKVDDGKYDGSNGSPIVIYA